MRMLHNKSRRAVTMTELLVVLAIISLLATIAVPVYINQIQRARITTAQAEVRAIAEAQQQVAIVHGFLVPIHILDNVPDPRPQDPVTSGSRDDFESIGNPGSRYLIDVYRPLAGTGNNSNQDEQWTLNTDNIRVNRLIEQWQGPFLNPQRVRFVGENQTVPGSGELTEDLVVDPWGNPYRMYSEFGITGSDNNAPSTTVDTITLGLDDLQLNVTGDEPSRFDRWAVVSYGPDGITSYTGAKATNIARSGDDIFYEFTVFTGNETAYSGF